MITAKDAKNETDLSIKLRVKANQDLIDDIERCIRIAITKGRYNTTLMRDNMPGMTKEFFESMGYNVTVNQEYQYVNISWK
jgi:uncharacterized Ntn-hydrolase superfamily protein